LTKIKAAPAIPDDKGAMRPVLHLVLLAVALALALVPAAVAARTVHGPVTEMVICGDAGAQTIRLDAQGNPVEPGQCCDCLDCLVLVAGLPLSAALPGADLRALPAPAVTDLSVLPLPLRHLRPAPRGPPLASPASDSLSQARLSPAALELGQVPRGKAVARTGRTEWVARC
jgi:hypothetical protein